MVLPEAELSAGWFTRGVFLPGGGGGGRVSRSRGQKRLGRDRLALAGSRSARGGFCVRPGAGGEEA